MFSRPASPASKRASKSRKIGSISLPLPWRKREKRKSKRNPVPEEEKAAPVGGKKKRKKKKKAGIYGFDQRKSEQQGEGGR